MSSATHWSGIPQSVVPQEPQISLRGSLASHATAVKAASRWNCPEITLFIFGRAHEGQRLDLALVALLAFDFGHDVTSNQRIDAHPMMGAGCLEPQ